LPQDQILDKFGVAELLLVKQRTVDLWMARGFLPFFKVGRSVRFSRADMLRYWQEHFRIARLK